MKKLIFHKRNFFKNTYCIFDAVDASLLPKKTPDYTSRSGSQYFYTNEGVFRISSHWGRAATCRWRLRVNIESAEYGQKIGFAKWAQFYTDNDVEPLYFINKNPYSEAYEYFHKDEPFFEERFILRTAPETRKILRQIKTLSTETSWAKYVIHNDIEDLRSYLINGLITSKKPLHELKNSYETFLE